MVFALGYQGSGRGGNPVWLINNRYKPMRENYLKKNFVFACDSKRKKSSLQSPIIMHSLFFLFIVFFYSGSESSSSSSSVSCGNSVVLLVVGGCGSGDCSATHFGLGNSYRYNDVIMVM